MTRNWSGAKTIIKQTRKSSNREYYLQSHLGWLCNWKEEFDYEIATHRTGPPLEGRGYSPRPAVSVESTATKQVR